MMLVGTVVGAPVALVAAGVLELPQAEEIAAEVTAVLVELGAAASALVVEAAAETIYP